MKFRRTTRPSRSASRTARPRVSRSVKSDAGRITASAGFAATTQRRGSPPGTSSWGHAGRGAAPRASATASTEQVILTQPMACPVS
jgi:hypothetical protein